MAYIDSARFTEAAARIFPERKSEMIPSNMLKFYIDGAWVDPLGESRMAVENPATEEIVAEMALESAAEVDRAVAAALAAFDSCTMRPLAERLAVLRRVLKVYNARYEEPGIHHSGSQVCSHQIGPW